MDRFNRQSTIYLIYMTASAKSMAINKVNLQKIIELCSNNQGVPLGLSHKSQSWTQNLNNRNQLNYQEIKLFLSKLKSHLLIKCQLMNQLKTNFPNKICKRRPTILRPKMKFQLSIAPALKITLKPIWMIKTKAILNRLNIRKTTKLSKLVN